MTEKEVQEQVVHITEEPQEQQKKPRRRSFFQISKDQMISTKELWLQKFKPNSANENQPEEIKSPLSSPVELPRIEQLQPINTDISSEIQFHQQQFENNEISKSPDGAGDAIEQVNEEADTHNPNDETKDDENQETDKTQTKSDDDDHGDVAAVDPQHKKDQPIVKRSSTFLKFLFPKKGSSTSADDVIVTESSSTEKHLQSELNAGCKDMNASHKTSTKENHSEQVIDYDDDDDDNDNNDKKDATGEPSTPPQPDRPSSPLGRRINAFLTRIPTLKEKPSSGKNNNSKLLDSGNNGVDEKVKKGSTTVVDAAPDTNYEDEKLATLTSDTPVVGTTTENSIVAI
ncbi:hypothetical protein BCR42DRAFT_451018 [Absidia repens]|uniref:Uncharacterized protein n=1 Tax=Absidia repens TaxID=90262 RepID=A0A1X2IIS2_9FUNG|nr:hypothetical protein BCR42DRAFT_451018 [Absidia repens]